MQSIQIKKQMTLTAAAVLMPDAKHFAGQLDTNSVVDSDPVN